MRARVNSVQLVHSYLPVRKSGDYENYTNLKLQFVFETLSFIVLAKMDSVKCLSVPYITVFASAKYRDIRFSTRAPSRQLVIIPFFPFFPGPKNWSDLGSEITGPGRPGPVPGPGNRGIGGDFRGLVGY